MKYKPNPMLEWQPDSVIYYRYDDRMLWDGEGGIKIAERQFIVVKKTPRGAWVQELNELTGFRHTIPCCRQRFIRDVATKRFCYPTKAEAMESLKARKISQVHRLKTDLLKAEAGCRLAFRDGVEVEKTYYDPTITEFREY